MGLAVFLYVRLAFAQSAPERAEAEALFGEGLRLHDTSHNYEALDRFRRAFAILPTANGLSWMAREEQLLGRDLEAIGHYRDALRSGLLMPKNAAQAIKAVTELERKLVRLTVTGAPGIHVVVDGKDRYLPIAEPIDVLPGAITLTGERDGITYQGAAITDAGAAATISLRAIVAPDKQAPRPAAPGRDVEQPRRGPSTAKIVTVVSVGGAALVTGVVAVVVAVSSASNADSASTLRAQLPSNNACATAPLSITCVELKSAVDDEFAQRHLAIGFGVAAGVLAITDAALFLFWPKAGSSFSVGPAGKNGAIIGWHASF